MLRWGLCAVGSIAKGGFLYSSFPHKAAEFKRSRVKKAWPYLSIVMRGTYPNLDARIAT